MKTEKFFGVLFIAIGVFLLADFLGFAIVGDYLFPAVLFILIGYFAAVRYFGKSAAVFVLSAGLFFSGITLGIESLVKIRHYNEFFCAAFFLSAALIFLLLFLADKKRKHNLIISLVLLFTGYSFVTQFPPRYLRTLALSIENLLAFSPFLFLFVGFKLLREA